MNRWSETGISAYWDYETNSEFKISKKEIKSNSKKFNFLDEEVPDFFIEDESSITKTQSEFYNEVLFPNYDDFDDYGTLLEKGSNNLFTKKVDDEIPYNSKVLELGCGTGQFSLYISRYNRIIHGVDISKGSLRLGEGFRKKNERNNVFFSRMNVFNMFFKKEYFDFIVSNGVLHHTKDAKLAFENLVKLLKPKGYIIIGLYHYYGRLLTNFKQKISPHVGDNIKFFDKTLRNMKSEGKKHAWKQDQFFNPHETSHTLLEILDWFKENDLEFVNSLPFTFKHNKKIFEKQKSPSKFDLLFGEPLLAFNLRQIREGGFFIAVGKKN